MANVSITSVSDYNSLLATALSNGGDGGFVYQQDEGNLYYSADGDFSGGGTLVAVIHSNGVTPWTYDIAGFMLV